MACLIPVLTADCGIIGGYGAWQQEAECNAIRPNLAEVRLVVT
jgi:hypothetical protein